MTLRDWCRTERRKFVESGRTHPPDFSESAVGEYARPTKSSIDAREIGGAYRRRVV